ncbi:DUF4123 domain-containing protein [Pseudomonas sp.]|uniref:DUF4123 domain-containing protein n=1 Tax=Pseudomonas sp. TaxID=306 RepID=UPI003D0E460C
MNSNGIAWLEMLAEQARNERLPHLDLVVDATGSSYPLEALQALAAPPVQALLFSGLPESTLATQGPVLLRFDWKDAKQQAALTELVSMLLPQQRLLALFSAWPFQRLAMHLTHHLQAEWNQGRSSGLLRFYDPRLFLATCEMLDPKQAQLFHAPVSSWHWIDRDGALAQLSGMPASPSDIAESLPTLQMNNPQVAMLVAWTSAELMRRDYALQPQHYSLGKQESLIRHLVHAQLAADRANCSAEQRDEYVFDWLANNSSTSPPRQEIAS